jgi:hypothetical protein
MPTVFIAFIVVISICSGDRGKRTADCFLGLPPAKLGKSSDNPKQNRQTLKPSIGGIGLLERSG